MAYITKFLVLKSFRVNNYFVYLKSIKIYAVLILPKTQNWEIFKKIRKYKNKRSFCFKNYFLEFAKISEGEGKT